MILQIYTGSMTHPWQNMYKQNAPLSLQIKYLMKTNITKNIRLLFLAVPLISFSIISGCASHKTSKIVPSAQEINLKFIEEMQNAIISNEKKITSIKTNANIKLKSPMFRVPVKFKGVLRYNQPNSIRLVASKYSYTLFDMVYNNTKLFLYIPQDRSVFSGPIDRSTKIKITDLTIRPYDIVNIFNFEEHLKDKDITIKQDKDEWVVHVYDPHDNPKRLLSTIYIDNNKNVTKHKLMDKKGKTDTLITFNDYKEIDGCRIPHGIKIKWPYSSTYLIFAFNDLVVNEELSAQMFDFNQPDGTTIVPISMLQ